MDNFDKLFQDKLGEITENDFEFKDSSWERFQNERNETTETTRQFVPLLWAKRNITAAAIILLLLMSNVFFAQQFLGTRTDLKKLTTTIDELRVDIVSCQEKSETYTKAVAVLETKVEAQAKVIEEQTELIITNRNQASFLPIFPTQNSMITNDNFNSNGNSNGSNITNNSTSNGMLNPNPNANLNDENLSNNLSNRLNNSGNIVDNQSINNQTGEILNDSMMINNREIANNTTSNSSKSEVNEIQKSMEELNRLEVRLDNKIGDKIVLNKGSVPIENKDKISLESKLNLLIEDAKPSAYQVGINSKYTFIPTFSNLPSMSMTNNGVIANALFFNNFRLEIGANYWGQFFKLEDIETLGYETVTSFTEEYPTVLSVNALDELSKVETKTYGFDLPITAQVMLRPNAKLNPYIGFGVIGRYYNNYQLEYYYLDNISDYEYEVKEEGLVGNFNFGILESQIGMDYSITNNWFVNFEINYLRSIKEQSFGLSNIQQYGASLGVKYEF